MAEVEKIYCCDRPCNNDALAYAMANQKNNSNDLLTMAMLGGGGMNGFNNPFAYLIWMMFANRFGFGNDGFGNGQNAQNAQNIEMQNQLQAIRSQLQDNQNSNLLMDAIKGNANAIQALGTQLGCDFNSLKDALCDVRAGISKFGDQIGYSAEKVINAVNLGNTGIITALKDCCCATQKEILSLGSEIKLQSCQQTYELRNGQRDLGAAIAQGFASSSYETQKQTSDIITATNASAQRIIDLISANRADDQAREIQDLKNEVARQKQTQELMAMFGRGNFGCGGCNPCNPCGC